jgi:molybdenum cofactor biosynthesis enzyme MoaA
VHYHRGVRSETLLVTRRCTERCVSCDRVDPRARPEHDPPLALLEQQLRTARERGAAELVLSGGEPTLRADLSALVRAAVGAGFSRVRLETNANRIGARLARELADAGLHEATVSFLAADPGRHRALAGVSSDPRAILRGMRALLDAGVRVGVRLPIVAGAPPAAARLRGLVAAMPGLGPFVLAPLPHADRSTLADELGDAMRAAESLGVELEPSREHPLAPCGPELPPRARRLLSHVLRERPGPRNTAHEACATCALSTLCTLDRASLDRALGAGAPRALADERPFLRPGKSPGARLHVLGARDVETFFHVDYEYEVAHETPTSRVGIIYRCNQVCTFCELADMDVDLSRERVERALDEAFARGSRRVILTGGEPTLSPDLLSHLAHARALGFTTIELQTNAIAFDRPGLAAAARAAGLTHAQISLHGADPEVSDRLTAAPGTHARTVRGVTALLEAGVTCLLNHLVFRDTCAKLEAFVDFVDARWGAHRERLVVQFHSPRNEFPSREEALRHVPRYSDYVDELRRAIDRCRALGIPTRDAQDPTGIPALCVLAADPRYLGRIAAQAEAPRVHAWEKGWLTRVAACERCELASACMGIPRTYLELHGDAEFHPLRREAVRASSPASGEVGP